MPLFLLYFRNLVSMKLKLKSGVRFPAGHCKKKVLVWKAAEICYEITNEPPHDKTNKMACAPSEDSDQTAQPPSLIRVFAVRMKKVWVLSYPLSAQRRFWSDWADAQADLSLRWAHSYYVGFVTRRLRWGLKNPKKRLDVTLTQQGFMSPHNLYDWNDIISALNVFQTGKVQYMFIIITYHPHTNSYIECGNDLVNFNICYSSSLMRNGFTRTDWSYAYGL